MTDHSFSVSELKSHSSQIDSLASDLKQTASKADAINLGDASYGILVGPMAATVGRLMLEAYAEVVNGLADNFSASAEKLDKTTVVYEELERGNADASTRMV